MTKETESPIEGGYPRIMQSLTYQHEDIDEEKIKNDTKLYAEHDAYVRNQSFENGGKVDIHICHCSQNVYTRMGLSSVIFDYHFDNAIEEELEEFARNDPWVKAGVIKQWKINLEMDTYSPCETVRFNKDGGVSITFGT